MRRLILAACISFVLLGSGCLGPVPGLFPAAAGARTETLYVVNHGWHTGLIVPVERLPPAARPPLADSVPCRFLEFGWGDDGFYRAEKVTSGIAVKALFWRNPSVLHVVALDDSPDRYFEGSGLIQLTIGEAGFTNLCAYLAGSFGRGPLGQPVDLGVGIYGDSRFYRATGHYFFPNTCNKWTARAIRSTGAPITPFYSVRSRNVFNQCRSFGTVLREFDDD